MTTKTIFNIEKSLKNAAMKKARKDGMSLSAVLNIALREYVRDNLKIIALERSIARGEADIKAGRVISQDELFKQLGL